MRAFLLLRLATMAMSQQSLPPVSLYTGSYTEDVDGDGVRLNAFQHEDASIAYPFDGHNVLKRTKISTSEKPTILHGGTSDAFKTGTKIRCLKSHSDISVYLGECSHLQPL